MSAINPAMIERAVDGVLVLLEILRVVAPAITASRAAKSAAFRALAKEAGESLDEPTETEREAEAAKVRLGMGGGT